MLKFYLFGVTVTFCMLMFIFFKTRPWAEEDGLPDDAQTTVGVILACIISCAILSLFSWAAAALLFVKRLREIRDDN